ncbi:hypothetical protein P5673_013314 [Acropora cervicornis]|uniref:Uncharacterized protein n=1 Tax=Acropora cervicornis TaxID=6130 RepID=A0AAD9V7G9_ACRCE|nr:hypothetical protein P5673_013314 [Acropora cervicornis]
MKKINKNLGKNNDEMRADIPESNTQIILLATLTKRNGMEWNDRWSINNIPFTDVLHSELEKIKTTSVATSKVKKEPYKKANLADEELFIIRHDCCCAFGGRISEDTCNLP